MKGYQLIRSLVATALVSGASASASASVQSQTSFIEDNKNTKSINIKDFPANTTAGKGLLSAARNGNRNLEDSMGDDYLGDYSIKFQDCHSVTEWNGDDNTDGDGDGDGETGTRVLSRRLVRFRLCPTSSCDHNVATGCTSRYGDYVVDINTFVYYYLTAQADANDDIDEYCEEECEDDDGAGNCSAKCLKTNGYVSFNDASSSLDPADYAMCGAFDNYYLGPYCSNDGQSIHLGLFSEDSCSTFVSCDKSCFYSAYGYNLPYASTSLVSDQCLSCADGTINNGYGENEAREDCMYIYSDTGKCETKMYIDYPNESACTYVQGLKFLGKDGVINSRGAVKRSTEAGAAIGLMSFSSVLLALYVHYLYSKLDRARFHLKNYE